MKLNYLFHTRTYKYFDIQVKLPAAEEIKFIAIESRGYIFGYKGEKRPTVSTNGDWWSKGSLDDPSPFLLGHVDLEGIEDWRDTCEAVADLERVYE